MSDCRFGVSPVNYPDPDPDLHSELRHISHLIREDLCKRITVVGIVLPHCLSLCTQNRTHISLD